jgi:hypothetical protein
MYVTGNWLAVEMERYLTELRAPGTNQARRLQIRKILFELLGRQRRYLRELDAIVERELGINSD